MVTDISAEIKQIESASRGEDVRDAIVDSLNAFKDDLNTCFALNVAGLQMKNCTINRSTGEINAEYETGLIVKYTYKETDDGVEITNTDGTTTTIKLI